MSTGMRKWMEKDCPEIEYLSAQVLIDREELKQLRADLETYKAERDALRAKIAEMEKQEPVKYEFQGQDGVWYPFINQRHYENTVADGSWPIRALYALPGAQNIPKKLCYDSRWEISIDYVDGWNAAVDMMRGKSPSWHCPDCCIAFPFGAPKSCPHDDARCNSLLAAASPEAKP